MNLLFVVFSFTSVFANIPLGGLHHDSSLIYDSDLIRLVRVPSYESFVLDRSQKLQQDFSDLLFSDREISDDFGSSFSEEKMEKAYEEKLSEAFSQAFALRALALVLEEESRILTLSSSLSKNQIRKYTYISLLQKQNPNVFQPFVDRNQNLNEDISKALNPLGALQFSFTKEVLQKQYDLTPHRWAYPLQIRVHGAKIKMNRSTADVSIIDFEKKYREKQDLLYGQFRLKKIGFDEAGKELLQFRRSRWLDTESTSMYFQTYSKPEKPFEKFLFQSAHSNLPYQFLYHHPTAELFVYLGHDEPFSRFLPLLFEDPVLQKRIKQDLILEKLAELSEKLFLSLFLKKHQILLKQKEFVFTDDSGRKWTVALNPELTNPKAWIADLFRKKDLSAMDQVCFMGLN